MSKTAESTRQRAVEAIRKIAKAEIDENQRLGPAEPKARIGKARGAAYFNANGEIVAGDDVPDDAPTDSADSETDTPTTDDEGVVKAKNYQSISGADNAQVGDTFDQFEGFDCTTGDAIQLDLTPQEGIEYVPPDGWDDADTPPPDEYYSEGYYWAGNGWNGHSPSEVAAKYNSAVGGGLRFTYENNFVNNVVIRSYWIANNNYNGLFSATRYSCGGDASDYCVPLENSSRVTEWPSNNTADLILQNGTFQAHSMDPDAAATYKTNPPAEVEICDGQGNRYSVTAMDGGGALVTKRDGNGDPVSGGRSLVIDKNGTVAKKVLNGNRDWYL